VWFKLTVVLAHEPNNHVADTVRGATRAVVLRMHGRVLSYGAVVQNGLFAAFPRLFDA